MRTIRLALERYTPHAKALLADASGLPLRTTQQVYLVQGDAIYWDLCYLIDQEPETLPDETIITVAGSVDGTTVFATSAQASACKTENEHYLLLTSLNTAELQQILESSASVSASVDIEIAWESECATWRLDVIVLKEAWCGEPQPGRSYHWVRGLAGSVSVPNGANQVEVALQLEPDEAIAAVLLSLRIPSADAPLLSLTTVGTPLPTGFTVGLSAPTPTEGYHIDYLAILQ